VLGRTDVRHETPPEREIYLPGSARHMLATRHVDRGTKNTGLAPRAQLSSLTPGALVRASILCSCQNYEGPGRAGWNVDRIVRGRPDVLGGNSRNSTHIRHGLGGITAACVALTVLGSATAPAVADSEGRPDFRPEQWGATAIGVSELWEETQGQG